MNNHIVPYIYAWYDEEQSMGKFITPTRPHTLLSRVQNMTDTTNWSESVLAQVFDQIFRGIAHMHGQGIVHRQITPGVIAFSEPHNKDTVVRWGWLCDVICYNM